MEDGVECLDGLCILLVQLAIISSFVAGIGWRYV